MSYKKKCLLIDDDRDDQLVFSIIVEKLGQSILCVTADNAAEGLRKLEDPIFIPDTIFLDLNMPGTSGMDLLAKIKCDSRLLNIPVVIYTTSSRKEDVSRAALLGASAYIVKSFDIEDVSRKIGDSLQPERQ